MVNLNQCSTIIYSTIKIYTIKYGTNLSKLRILKPALVNMPDWAMI